MKKQRAGAVLSCLSFGLGREAHAPFGLARLFSRLAPSPIGVNRSNQKDHARAFEPERFRDRSLGSMCSKRGLDLDFCARRGLTFRRTPLRAAAICFGSASAFAAPLHGGACVWALGDSLTLGYQAELAKLMPERRVIGGGFGAQTSTQIAARAGAVKTRASVAGDRIPASDPVPVTEIAPRLISSSAKFDEIEGVLAGRHGKLTRDAANNIVFTPEPAASDTEAPPNSAFTPDARDTKDCILVFWAGQNNFPAIAQILADTDAALAPYVRAKKPFLVIGMVNDEQQIRGSLGYQMKMQLSKALAQRYAANYIDIGDYLVEHGLHDAGLVADAADQADIANGVVPHALRQDRLHPNNIGNRLIAKRLAAAIAERHW